MRYFTVSYHSGYYHTKSELVTCKNDGCKTAFVLVVLALKFG